jgi:hypothetical protein
VRRAAVVLSTLILLSVPAAAIAAPTWHSQQPPGGGGFPLLGEVGDLECWNGEANRCLLITAGNAGIAPGLFAYDGSSWYRYSTVCGGHQGRIAWAGPDEFWTISDQQPAGQTPGAPAGTYVNISLCHFKDGQVVASYGEPAGAASSYRHMAAAACAGPSECWFAGERLPEASASGNLGAFHLRWNGGSLAATPSLTVPSDLSDPGRAVTGLAFHEGHLYEGVDVEASDIANNEREAEEEAKGLGPSFVHRVEGPAEPFEPLFGEGAFDYGGPFAEAGELEGFRLTGLEGRDLWAIAGSAGSEATVTVLRFGAGGLTQLPLADQEGVLGPETLVAAVAAEPGPGDAAWVAFRPRTDPAENLSVPARLVRVHGDGTVDPKVELPPAGEELGGEPVGRKGVAGAIACPAAEQCWLATRKGWLFHLGFDPAPQGDPAMHVLVTSRPPDNSLPTLPPLELPEDTSGANGSGASPEEELPIEFEEPPRRKPALLSKIRQRLIGGSLLELSFKLRAKAHVQLLASRKGSVVAKTKRYTLARGRHSLRLRLDPKRWPTKLDLKAHAVKPRGSK